MKNIIKQLNRKIKKLLSCRNIEQNTCMGLTEQHNTIIRFAFTNGWRRSTLNRIMRVYNTLIDQIDDENNRIILFVQTYMYKVDLINSFIQIFNKTQQPTLQLALKELRTVHINIYDLVYGEYEMVFSTVHALRRYTHQHDLRFPLHKAKNEPILKMFLRQLF